MLETKIEELTKAINTLTEFLKGEDLKQVTTTEKAKPVKEVVKVDPVKEKARKEAIDMYCPTPTCEDLKETCLDIARSIPDGKTRVKELLKEYGAKKAADVKAEQREELIGKLKGMY